MLPRAIGIRSAVVRTMLGEEEAGGGEGGYGSSDSPPSIDQDGSAERGAGLSYLGVFVVLGLTREDFYHPLLDERGFYTLDGASRMFTMPYEGSRIDDADDDLPGRKGNATAGEGGSRSTVGPRRRRRRRRIMWQLSFRLSDPSDAEEMGRLGPEALLDEVRQRTKGWHDPMSDMIRSTPLETVWGT